MTLATTAPSGMAGHEGGGVWRLLVVHAPDRQRVGDSRPLVSSMVLGREPAVEGGLALDDAEVSRRHVRLSPEGHDGGWRVDDLGSRNGTFLDGKRVGEQGEVLAHGSVLRIGAHLLLVQYLTASDLELFLLRPPKSDLLVGQSLALLRVLRTLSTVGPSEVPILITGETGVGKELVAAEAHERSGRTGEFVPVNCAALPAHLVESELFGHAKGAFTGASSQSEGLFGRADGGTLFLDEVGEMPVELQPKLLRALATGEVRGVGEARERHIDVRVVAATNVDLEHAVAAGTFRADLHSRLLASHIRVAPLRERRDDILELATHFAPRARALSPDAAEALLVHPWPYNVRELRMAVTTAALAAPAGLLELKHLPDALFGPVHRRHSAKAATPAVPLALGINRNTTPSADELRDLLRHFGGNVADVARFFGKDRRQIYRWADRLGVDLDALR